MCDSFIMVPPPPIHIPITNGNIPHVRALSPPPPYELYRYAPPSRTNNHDDNIYEPDDDYFELHNEDNIMQTDCSQVMCIFLIIILVISGWIVATVV